MLKQKIKEVNEKIEEVNDKIEQVNQKVKKSSVAKTVIGIVFLVIFATVTVLGLVFHNEIFGKDAWLNNPNTGFGVLDAVLKAVPIGIESVYVLFATMLALYASGFIVKLIFKGTPRKVTIGKLVDGIMKVVIWAVGIIAVLAICGVDVAALITGAGVLTLVIGLGMQSLIADVVAGVFLVCDGTLQVGDIVTIDGWRGTVQEIGIRNTKLINYSGDIRVANNSTIKVFVNQSREDSYPTVIVGVPYEQNLQRVREVFEANKGKIRGMCSCLLSDIDFNGVEELAESSVNLHFGAKCKEGDFFLAQREMRGAIKTVFEENGILVPFPQVDVHFDKQS